MSITKIKKALERHLSGLTPSVPTSYEGVSFSPPAGVYQVVQIVPRTPEDPVFGAGYHREKVTLQILIVGPNNKGTAEVLNRAELVSSRFKKGTFLLEDGIRIHFLRTPQISGVSSLQDRLVCPVIVDVTAEVTS